GDLTAALGDELAVGGTTTGADPFRGCGGTWHCSGAPSGRGKLLKCSSDELRRLGRRALGQRGANRVVGGSYPVTKSRERPHGLFRSGKPYAWPLDGDLTEPVLQLQDQPLRLFSADATD